MISGILFLVSFVFVLLKKVESSAFFCIAAILAGLACGISMEILLCGVLALTALSFYQENHHEL